ncbi:unnamed protein product [Bathycoccus prasinos]
MSALRVLETSSDKDNLMFKDLDVTMYADDIVFQPLAGAGLEIKFVKVLPHSAEAATAYESAFSDSSFANPGPPKEDPESSLGGGKFEFDVYPPLDGPDDTTPTATNFHHASYAMHPFFMCFLAKFDYLFHHVSPRVIDSLPDRWKRQLQEKPRDDITWTLETVKNMTESTEAPVLLVPSLDFDTIESYARFINLQLSCLEPSLVIMRYVSC